MNQLCLVLAVFVAFIFYGGRSVPPVLKKYKMLILGLTIGCFACCALSMNIEGMSHHSETTTCGAGADDDGD